LEFVPQDQATVNGWYRNRTEIRQSTAALYGRVWWSVNDQFSWLTGDVMSGDMHHTWDVEGQFFYMSFNETNQYIGQGWQGFYDVISYANLIIDDMPGIAKSNGVDDATINAGLGEAHFMRGIAYFMLTEFWGETPIVERPAEKISSGNLQLPKNTSGSLYEFARRDLVFAAENLPTSDDAGRVTSWAAKGMLAKLHVTLGQRSVGGGDIGSAADFATAAAYAADVINNSGRILASNYENLFKIANEHDPEILFAPQLINGGWGYGSSRQARFARSTEITGDATAWGSGKCPTISFISNLEANAEGEDDARRKAIYSQLGDYYNYVATTNGGYTYNIVSRDDEDVQIEGATPTLTSVKKHVVGNDKDHGYVITNQDSPFDIYYLRLADVYLLYAEALLGANASLSSGPGYDAYLAVRERAGLEPPADGSITFIDIFNERRVEFGFEAQSWLDVKRRFYRNKTEAIAYLNSQDRADRYFRIDSDDALENDPAGYEVVPAGTTSPNDNTNTDTPIEIFEYHMQLPLPASEVVANPLLAKDEEAVEYVFE
ncbi:MAG TPA: RagB/SusD family nutrient uptake outer membrane protein, partial [Ohtaekwangia sp.]